MIVIHSALIVTETDLAASCLLKTLSFPGSARTLLSNPVIKLTATHTKTFLVERKLDVVADRKEYNVRKQDAFLWIL